MAQQKAELAEVRAERFAMEARLASLEARLEPHFLFNTLSTIVELIHEDPAGAGPDGAAAGGPAAFHAGPAGSAARRDREWRLSC